MKQFLYSTLDGKAIRQPKDTGTDNLLEAILEMMLIHPVDWIAVQDQLVADIESFISSPGISVKIINFGPGYGISKAFHPSLAQLEIIDACTSLGSSRYATDASPVIEDGIAIVGMAVDLPGASNTSELWKILSEGINTVTDVSFYNRDLRCRPLNLHPMDRYPRLAFMSKITSNMNTILRGRAGA